MAMMLMTVVFVGNGANDDGQEAAENNDVMRNSNDKNYDNAMSMRDGDGAKIDDSVLGRQGRLVIWISKRKEKS